MNELYLVGFMFLCMASLAWLFHLLFVHDDRTEHERRKDRFFRIAGGAFFCFIFFIVLDNLKEENRELLPRVFSILFISQLALYFKNRK